MRGKKTSDEKREEIRAILAVNPDASSKDIAKIVRLPDRTVREILPDIVDVDEFAAYRQQQKMKAIQRAWEIATLYMEELLKPEKAEKASARDSIIVAGTAIDKAQLLAGEPTAISERRESVSELLREYEDKLNQYKALVNE